MTARARGTCPICGVYISLTPKDGVVTAHEPYRTGRTGSYYGNPPCSGSGQPPGVLDWALIDQLTDRLTAITGGLINLGAVTLSRPAAETVRRVVGQLNVNPGPVIDDLTAAGVIPADPPNEWWPTPLGQLVARTVASGEPVTHATAAAMLKVTRGTIAQLVNRGTLERHPDGGITRASIQARLNR